VTRLKRGSSGGSAPWRGRWATAGMVQRWAKGGGELDRRGEEERGGGGGRRARWAGLGKWARWPMGR
jgi:hypothetical protein